MSEPKNHHLVPICYLKNFGKAKHGKTKSNYFVDVFDKRQQEKGVFSANAKSICVEKEFYTFSKLAEDQKRFLEKYFSEKVERHYTPLYKKIISSDPLYLDETERNRIIEFVIHQFFRTSKLTNNFNEFWSNVLSRGYEMSQSPSVLKQVDLGGRIIDFEKQSLEEVTKDELRSNKEYVNATNYYRIKQLVEARKGDHVAVEKIHPDHFLITSDNPVTFNGMYNNPDVIIHMPINSEYLLTIMPKSKLEPGVPLYRRTPLPKSYSEIVSTYNNLYQLEKCERVIIGTKSNLEDAVKMKENFNMDVFTEKAKAVTESFENVIKQIESSKTS